MEVLARLRQDPRLIIPVGTTEQHGPHLPLGCDTLIVERLANDLSADFQVLCAPTIESGVNAHTEEAFAGSATLRRKTLHRVMNDLLGSWEDGGVEEFVILTAHGQAPHQEALSTLRTRHAQIRTVDIFAVPYQQHPDRELEWFDQGIMTDAQAKGPLTTKEYLDARAECIRLARPEGIDTVMDEHRLDAVVAPTVGPAWLSDVVQGGA